MEKESLILPTRKTTEEEQQVLERLNEIREEGQHNMFGVAPVIRAEFSLETKSESRQLVKLWMDNFNEEGNYSSVKEEGE